MCFVFHYSHFAVPFPSFSPFSFILPIFNANILLYVGFLCLFFRPRAHCGSVELVPVYRDDGWRTLWTRREGFHPTLVGWLRFIRLGLEGIYIYWKKRVCQPFSRKNGKVPLAVGIACPDQLVCCIYLFSTHFCFPASGQAVVTGPRCRPFFPPVLLPSIFIAHRVQQSHCSSIFIECC